MKPIKPGDYFLQPYRGTRRELLVQAVRYIPSVGQWETHHFHGGHNSICLLTSCRRCSPSLAKRILNPAGCPAEKDV